MSNLVQFSDLTEYFLRTIPRRVDFHLNTKLSLQDHFASRNKVSPCSSKYKPSLEQIIPVSIKEIELTARSKTDA